MKKSIRVFLFLTIFFVVLGFAVQEPVKDLINGQEWDRTIVKNHVSGTGNFSIELKDLPLGVHIITSIARDLDGKESFLSDVLIINILPSTPAPILNIKTESPSTKLVDSK